MKGFQARELVRVIEIDRKICKGCDFCKAFCPAEAIDGKYGTAHTIDKTRCVACGQCLVHCPFGAPRDMVDGVDKVIEKLETKQLTVVGTIAPAVRVAIGEEFGMEPGSLVTAKLYGALKQAGFKILDTNFTADQTILEEGLELIGKIRHYALGEPAGQPVGPLPQFTSCCPAWIRYAELYYPELIPHLSSVKSPMMIAGALAKTYGAKEVWQVQPEELFMVGIMPCTAKKFEASRPEFTSAAAYWNRHGKAGRYPDVDAVLTTRDLARLFKKLSIDFANVPEFTDQDNPFVQYSGAGVLFGNTGGVMEAALRTAYFVITGGELAVPEFKQVRGLAGVKEAGATMKDAKTGRDVTLKVAVAHGLKENAKPLLEQVRAGRSPYHFIEIMNCPGGCVNGGGQPVNPMDSLWLGKARAMLSLA
ncbi:[FeFe] hydrogenase, group A [Sporomusa termitida]|uniref:Periplasmic [Fe] hydrogenase large subunit n=1 Tax=Sporomusa termitida TaxID=2377 RepID=A0A517DWC6_9FIRM|nr:[FeFe] hydrogenase, group A [Sporomusa termitida]QDR81660.1 Periplasmic [Fe] hydrogenase large subunit [Sporomusa termitida]